jgi:hypothetical protein
MKKRAVGDRVGGWLEMLLAYINLIHVYKAPQLKLFPFGHAIDSWLPSRSLNPSNHLSQARMHLSGAMAEIYG